MVKFKYVDNVCCVLLLSYVSTWSAPIATMKLTSDLSQVNIDINQGGSLSFYQYESPLFSYMLQQTGMVPVDATVSGQNYYTDALPGNSASVSGFFDEGFSESMASATVSQGTATATSNVGSYIVFDAKDVSSVTLTLDVDASIDLLTESYGEWASGQWIASLNLSTSTGNGPYTPIGTTVTYNSGFYDAFDGDEIGLAETHNISISYDFGDTYNGLLRLQNTLTTDVLFDVLPPINVPEPSGVSMMIIGLAALLPLVRFRKR